MVLLALALALTTIFSPFASVNAEIAIEHSEYEQFVHTYFSSESRNITVLDKPMFPVYFNESQISIGRNWSISVPLLANHSYRVYCYGDWVNNGSAPKTDYDLYVYNPAGFLESEHTEAAGLPEHLGTRLGDSLFVPETSGNYTFAIVNDLRQSNGTQQATFMVMENIECDQWYSRSIEGKSQNIFSSLSTSCAYDFVTDKPNIEIWIQVPPTLDMYEARLYVMSDPESLLINEEPLPWEPGLYGDVSGKVGGYTLDSEKYRGVAYSSCEYRGKDMMINYTTTAVGKTLYHLVLIGESGSGNVDFLIKTQFEGACLVPCGFIGRIYPINVTTVSYISNSTDLVDAVLEYSIDNWNNSQTVNMTIVTRNCSAVIPAQKAGTFVNYRIVANDVLMNELFAEGNFTVKTLGMLNITAVPEVLHLGENITIQGVLTGQNGSVSLTAQLMGSLETTQVDCRTMVNGSFSTTLQPNGTGVWAVNVIFDGSTTLFDCVSNQIMVKVEEPTFIAKNGVFVGGGFIGIIAVSGVVFFIRKRRQ